MGKMRDGAAAPVAKGSFGWQPKRNLRIRRSASSAAGAKHLGHFPESGHPAGGGAPADAALHTR